MIEFLVAGLFSDHMVLQQQRSNALWGWDHPGQVVTLRVESRDAVVPEIKVTTDSEGRWRLLCPALPAGGPYRLRITGSDTRTIEDVEVGEVWLAGGQSNMEWPLQNTVTGPEEVAKSAQNDLRFYKVPRYAASSPQANVSGEWLRSSPQTAGSFSAIAYLFAKRLQGAQNVPVGIIDDNWGGTRVEAWISPQGLRQVLDLNAERAKQEDLEKRLPQLKAEQAVKTLAWEAATFPADPGNLGEGRGWARADFDDASWKHMRLPNTWQSQGESENGILWFRLKVALPAAWAGKPLRLSLGCIDDFDTTYVNGARVGGTARGDAGASAIKRVYDLPADLVRSGSATLAVRVYDQGGDGGMLGPRNLMFLECPGVGSLNLAGLWSYEREAVVKVGPIDWSHAPWPSYPQEQDSLSSLYDGMIAPVAGYGIRGILWYQGESNAIDGPSWSGPAFQYRDRFRALIRDWRAQWGEGDLPFLFVQLANFKANPGWPLLRESQELALQEPRTGMAVAIDVGNPDDIHPRDKRPVADRLYRLAAVQAYGVQGLESQGPQRRALEITGSQVIVRYAHAAGLHTTDGAIAVKGFELAGADGVFHAAKASLVADEAVRVVAEEVPAPCYVRYAYQDSPETNLVNGDGLPAQPFRSDNL